MNAICVEGQRKNNALTADITRETNQSNFCWPNSILLANEKFETKPIAKTANDAHKSKHVNYADVCE